MNVVVYERGRIRTWRSPDCSNYASVNMYVATYAF